MLVPLSQFQSPKRYPEWESNPKSWARAKHYSTMPFTQYDHARNNTAFGELTWRRCPWINHCLFLLLDRKANLSFSQNNFIQHWRTDLTGRTLKPTTATSKITVQNSHFKKTHAKVMMSNRLPHINSWRRSYAQDFIHAFSSWTW